MSVCCKRFIYCFCVLYLYVCYDLLSVFLTMNVRIDPSRYAVLSNEFNQPYFTEIKEFLVEEKKANKIIYPA